MEIHWTHLSELNPKIRAAAEARLQALAAGHDDLIDLRIAGHSTRHHRHGERRVRITCLARGRQVIATCERDDLELALNDVLDDFEREVNELRRWRRDLRTERPAQPPQLGLIDRLLPDQGYGFIITDDGTQVYFHRNAVHSGLHFEALEDGQRVALNVEPGEKGPQANAVYPPPPDASAP
jgi:cold shock CspA family protein/ribosome-associated translation inhibitor RaiA